jgi:hypothetical protein
MPAAVLQNGHAIRWRAEGHELFIAEPCRHRLASDVAGETKRLPSIELRHDITLIYFIRGEGRPA